MSKSEFRTFMDANQALPKDVLLGFMVWFTICDGAYDRQGVEDSFRKLDLDPQFIPEANSEINAFALACTNALSQCKPYEVEINGEEHFGEVLAIREAQVTNEKVVRQVVREIRDAHKARLDYSVVAELVLYRPVARSGKVERGSHRIRAQIFTDRVINDADKEAVTGVIERFDSEFDRIYHYLHGSKMRYLPRDYVKFLNGVQMKHGVYFVPSTREDELTRLQTFINGLGNGCQFEIIPLPDLRRLRSSVIDAFQKQAVEELTDVVSQIQKLRETRSTITASAYAKMMKRYQDVMLKAKEYTRTLKVTQDETAGAAEVALHALTALQADMVAAQQKKSQ